MANVTSETRVWTRLQAREGRRAARPAMVFGVATTLTAIGQAWCVATLLGATLAGRFPGVWPLAGFLLLALLRAGLGLLADRAALRSGAQGRHRLRADALQRLLAAGPALLREHHSAELAATLIDRIEALDGFFGRWIPAAFLALAGPALVLAAALLVDPMAGLILFGAGLLVPVGQAVSGIGAASASRRQFRAMARLQARFLDRVRGIATIVLAGRAGDEARALGEAADELRRRTLRVLRVAFLASVVLDAAAAVALVGLALRYRGLFGAQGGDPARALFMLLLVPEFFAPLRAFAAAYQDRLQAGGAAEALLALPKLPEATPPATTRQIEARGLSVSFDAVRFTWDAARGPALDGLSFFVPPGETLVLAGPSGAGKSTVIELLLGFVRPDAGRILINGHDIADFVPETLAGLTAWIGQRPTLFAGTIRENIGFARAGATAAEIDEAARRARVTEFAALLPDGLDQRIGEGGYGLSGGQAQRVAIARAFLRNARLLLLDEPTASLDPATEGEVLAALKNLAAGRTVILASHSAAAHAFSGRRLDLRDGRAVAQARGAA